MHLFEKLLQQVLELNKDYGEAHFHAEMHPLSKRYHVSTFMFFSLKR